MTREEAITELKYSIEMIHFDPVTGETSEWLNEENQRYVDACNIAIKALEQESCEDAISRQAVLDMMNYGILEDNIKTMPSVTPQPKMGRWWERNTYPQECRCWDCSECQETVSERTNYCPNCGAKMESEEEESDNLDSMLEDLWNAE